MPDWQTYRRIIDAYRTKLMEVSPAACNEIDDRMWAANLRWVCDDNPPDPSRYMTAKEISDLYGIEVHNIRAWARRHPEKIGTHRHGSRVLFLLREVLSYHASSR